MKKLQALYNDDVIKVIKEALQEKVTKNLIFLIDLAMVTTNTMSVPEEHTSFNEAWNHPNTTSQEKWQEVICKEFVDMNKQQVWHKTSKTLLLPNRRCVKNKWVFKIKRNSVFWARFVECGHSQVPGSTFQKTTLQ